MALSPVFGTRIRFVSPDTFETTRKERQIHPKSGASLSFEIQDRVCLAPSGFTRKAYNCNIMALHNRWQTTVAHLIPKNLHEREDDIRIGLHKDIQALKADATEPLRALITGGRGFESLETSASKRLFRLLHQIAQQAQIPHVSLIWGLTNGEVNNAGGTSLLCDPKQDEILLTNGKIPADSPHEIRKAFSLIRIAEGDTFETEDGQPVATAENSKRFKRLIGIGADEERPTLWRRLIEKLPF